MPGSPGTIRNTPEGEIGMREFKRCEACGKTYGWCVHTATRTPDNKEEKKA